MTRKKVPKALIDHERPTYYWLYRHINNMYKCVQPHLEQSHDGGFVNL